MGRQMMKNKIIITSVFGIVLLIVVAILTVIILNRVNMSFAEDGEVCFHYKDSKVDKQLSNKDFEYICGLFNGKFLTFDNPSCGFDENISVKFNGGDQIFCLAHDGCPIIYWKNKDKYFSLSENEYSDLKNILSEYGVYFPCI